MGYGIDISINKGIVSRVIECHCTSAPASSKGLSEFWEANLHCLNLVVEILIVKLLPRVPSENMIIRLARLLSIGKTSGKNVQYLHRLIVNSCYCQLAHFYILQLPEIISKGNKQHVSLVKLRFFPVLKRIH